MSFSWYCYGKNKENLFEKYNIHYKGLGLASDTDLVAIGIPYSLEDIRLIVQRAKFTDEYPPAAKELFLSIKQMLQHNLFSLKQNHCEICSCGDREKNWDMEQIKRFLRIPIEDVEQFYGGR